VIVLSEGGDWGWRSPASVAIIVGTIVLVGLWVRHELRVTDPLVDVRLVRNRSVLTADVSVLLSAAAMYLFLPVIVEFVQVPSSTGYGFGSSIVISGLVLVPLSVGSFLASRCLVIYERHFGRRSMVPFGSIVFAIAALFFAFEHRYLWEAFAVSGFCGIGIGFTFAAMPGFVVRAVAPSETGSATGFYQLQRALGMAVGSALAAAVLTAYTLGGHLFPGVEGFRVSLLVATGLCITTALVSYLLLGRETTGSSVLTKEVAQMMEEEAEIASTGLMLSEEASLGNPPVRTS
jgi:predicted MFS family arabinose efflux permease